MAISRKTRSRAAKRDHAGRILIGEQTSQVKRVKFIRGHKQPKPSTIPEAVREDLDYIMDQCEAAGHNIENLGTSYLIGVTILELSKVSPEFPNSIINQPGTGSGVTPKTKIGEKVGKVGGVQKIDQGSGPPSTSGGTILMQRSGRGKKH